MNDRSLEGREADALQEALERHSSLLADGTPTAEARAQALSDLGPEVAPLFSIAVGMGDATAAIPEPAFADAFEAKLRRTRVVTREEREARARRKERRQRLLDLFRMPQFGFAAAAAAIAIFAGLLVPAFRSLPGDSLYALKRTSEDARLGVVSGTREARLRLRLANERFEEVEHLVERAQVQGTGPGLAAMPTALDIKDPKIARLIEETLADAQEQIEVAATILISEPTGNATALDDLVIVSHRGRKLAAEVAEDLPAPSKPPILSNVVTFAKIEAEAKAARMSVEPAPPPPCDTPTPTSTATPEATATPEGATPTPSPQPTTTPAPTPCVSPEPTPTPETTPTPTPTPGSESASGTAPSPQPTTAPQQQNSGDAERAENSRWWSPQPTGEPNQT